MKLRLLLGVLAISTAAPLIRWAGAPPAFLAAGRLSLAALVLFPLGWLERSGGYRRWTAGQVRLTTLSGLFLGAHFLFWITSLGMTSVASSVFLVTLHPVVTSVVGHYIHGDRVGKNLGWALLFSALAAAALVGPDILREQALGAGVFGGRVRGDLLAFLGGLCASGYFLVGRAVRRDASTTTYAGLSYLVAALACWAAVLLMRVPVRGLPGKAYVAAALMAIGPQLIGHTAMNWALKRLAAGPVAVVITAEPVAASLMAWAWFGEAPPWGMALAIPLTFLGIQLATAGSGAGGAPSPEPPGSPLR